MKNKSPQAPKGKWRYGCVKRVYKTVLPDVTFSETSYEVVEVFHQGKAWSSEPRAVTAESKKALITQLKKVISDIEKYDVIVEKKSIVHKIGQKK